MSRSVPSGDSAWQATRFGLGVLLHPAFLWAPALLALIGAVPVLLMPELRVPPRTVLAGGDPLDYLLSLIPLLLPYVVVELAVSLLVGALATTVGYRLAASYVAGDRPAPFGPDLVPVALSVLVQSFLLFVGGMLAAGIGVVFGLLFTTIVGPLVPSLVLALVVVVVWLATRLALGPLFVVRGRGPIEGLRASWHATAGRAGKVFRWLFVSNLVAGVLGAIVGRIAGAMLGDLGAPLAELVTSVVAGTFGMVPIIVITLLWHHIRDEDDRGLPRGSWEITRRAPLTH